MKLYFIEFDEEGVTGYLFAPVWEEATNSLFCTPIKADAEKHAEIMQTEFPNIEYKVVEAEATFK